MRPNAALSQINMQIMWNRLIAVVEEQAKTLIRTSFSTTVREASDLSAGVFDTSGRMLAQAVTGTPGHVNSMANAVRHFLKEYPIETMSEGDSYISNDPWICSGHLHDITVVTPAFYRGEAVGLFAATVHIIDVGGRGLGPDGRSVFEEGLSIPIMPLARKGRMNGDLLKIVRANTREPLQVEGDMFSCAAAGEDGARRLVQMMDEFRIASLENLATFIIENSHEAMLAKIRKLPKGVFRNAVTLDGYEAPVTAHAALTISDEGIHVDYSGTSPVSSFGINVVLNYTEAYTNYGVRCAIAEEIPNNYGSMLPITASAPEGCILNAPRGAPVSARHMVGHICADAVLGCLHGALQGGAQAEGSMMWNPLLRGDRWFDGARQTWTTWLFNSGGTGARPARDGMSTTAFPSGVKIIPMEAAEAVAPIVVWRKEFRPGSGGPGRHRGGLGQILEIASAVEAPLECSAMFDRVENPARGRNGGQAGAPGVARLASGERLKAKGALTVPVGDRLRLDVPGGGGFGDPFSRPPEQVAEDVLDELISIEEARAQYGVAVSAEGVVDEAATKRLRAQR
jgi:N-methylhydantoinase B